MDTITERLALLVWDNKHRTLTEDADLRLGYGLCGALVQDLLLCNALELQPDGSLLPCPKAQFPAPFLREAFDAIPSYTELNPTILLKIFYEQMPQLKASVLENMVGQGGLRVDTEKLKWSFALKSYVLRTEKSGYRDKVIQALLANKIHMLDYWVVQLAVTSRLLWAEEGENKKRLHAAIARLRHVQALNGQTEPLLALLSETLPEAIAASHKLPKLRKKSSYPLTWEWRGFWADEGTTLIQSSEIYKQSLENISFSEITDSYLVIEGMAENIKSRKRLLELKRPVESLNGYTAFAPKESYSFPLTPKKAALLFPALNPPSKALSNIGKMVDWLHGNAVRCEQIEVKKKRFQVKLQSQVQVEFCTLQLAGRKFLSVCVEGPDYDITSAHSHNFQTGGVMAMGYVEFLKHCQMESAT
jgi:hypothetical protein